MNAEGWVLTALLAWGVVLTVILAFCKAAADQDRVSEEYHKSVEGPVEQQNDVNVKD